MNPLRLIKGYNIIMKSPTADTDSIEPDIAGAGVDLN